MNAMNQTDAISGLRSEPGGFQPTAREVAAVGLPYVLFFLEMMRAMPDHSRLPGAEARIEDARRVAMVFTDLIGG